MGDTRPVDPGPACARGRTRPAVEGDASGTQRDPLDLAYGSAVEGLTRQISTTHDLPPPLPAVGPSRRLPPRARGAGQGPGRAWRLRPLGVLHRRDLRPGQKRGPHVGKTKRGKGTKIMAVADGAGLPLAICIESASPHETTLVEETLDASFLDTDPEKLIGDKAYDSDPLDQKLAERGIEMIAPNRKNRNKTQDGRPLRRYRRRWKVERLFAWLQNFRRLVVRYEYHGDNFEAFVLLGCVVILLRHL